MLEVCLPGTGGMLPLPARWFDEVHCREYAIDGVYHFEVQADLLKGGYRRHPTMPLGQGLRRLVGARGRKT